MASAVAKRSASSSMLARVSARRSSISSCAPRSSSSSKRSTSSWLKAPRPHHSHSGQRRSTCQLALALLEPLDRLDQARASSWGQTCMPSRERALSSTVFVSPRNAHLGAHIGPQARRPLDENWASAAHASRPAAIDSVCDGPQRSRRSRRRSPPGGSSSTPTTSRWCSPPASTCASIASFRVFNNTRYPYIDVQQADGGPDRAGRRSRTTSRSCCTPASSCSARRSSGSALPDDLVARLEGKSSLGRLGLRDPLAPRASSTPASRAT